MQITSFASAAAAADDDVATVTVDDDDDTLTKHTPPAATDTHETLGPHSTTLSSVLSIYSLASPAMAHRVTCPYQRPTA